MSMKSLAILLMAIAIIMTVSCGTRKSAEGTVPASAETSTVQTPMEPASATMDAEDGSPATADEPKSSETPGAIAETSEVTAEASGAYTEEIATDQAAVDSFDRSSYPEPATLAEKFSYCFAIYLAANYGDQTANYYWIYKQQLFPELDDDYASIGLYDFSNDALIYTVDEINSILVEYQDDYNHRVEAQAAANLRKAEDFLSENRNAEGVHITQSGLQYKVLVQGTGERAAATDSVELDYELRTLDGTVIDSSYARGEHSTFGLNAVIEGFREGVMLMPMGSHYLFYIHPDLGYGANATGSMEANTLLIFEVETYSIVK